MSTPFRGHWTWGVCSQIPLASPRVHQYNKGILNDVAAEEEETMQQMKRCKGCGRLNPIGNENCYHCYGMAFDPVEVKPKKANSETSKEQ